MRIKLLFGFLMPATLAAAGISYAVRQPAAQSPHRHREEASHAGSIEGAVVDADGQPVSGAEVYALKSDFTTGKIPTAHTDKDGTFLITGLKPGVYTISAGKEEDGYARTDSPFHSTGLTAAPQVDVNEAQTTSGVVVCFGPKAAKLVGSLVDASTNKLIKDPQSAEIVLRRIDHPDYSYSTAPSLQGVFEILVPPVPLTAEISAPGYEKKLLGSLHLIPGETKRMGVSLHPNR